MPKVKVTPPYLTIEAGQLCVYHEASKAMATEPEPKIQSSTEKPFIVPGVSPQELD